MTNSNPLLEKYYEMFPEKKEKPKVIKTDKFEGEVTVSQVENAFKKWASKTTIKGNQIGYTYTDEITKPPSLTTYDPDDLKECFIKTAFEVKTGIAQIISMNMEMGHKYINTTGARITFEVSLDDY